MYEENINVGDATNANENNVSDDNFCSRVGYKLQTFFSLYGYFDGKVVRIMTQCGKVNPCKV